MDTNRFARFKEDCSALLSELEQLADADLRERARSALDRLQRERLKILVVGEFSRGKSTFVNALVGRPVLPSKVNPTTATINIIRGANEGVARVEFNDGSIEVHSLPEQRVNQFLDAIVTVANDKAASIRTVTIETPGRLGDLMADIVDTPGVNDLDQAREEVTFDYLRQADAAVMVLDAQQPLSESERAFLVDKVLNADVNRITFVINKADEVLYDGTVKDIERILDYVRARLKDLVGIPHPKVFAVSAKTALRARFKGEADPFPLSFDDFEEALLADAATQAVANPERLKVHLERVTSLAAAHLERLTRTEEGLTLDAAQLQSQHAAADQRRKHLSSRVDDLGRRLVELEGAMTLRGSSFASRKVDEMGAALAAELANAADDEAMEVFRQSLSTHLRGLLEAVEKEAAQERGRLLQAVQGEFPELVGLQRELSAADIGRKRGVEHFRAQAPLAVAAPSDTDSGSQIKDMAVGFGLGYVGAALFGPIGIAAGIVGSYLITKQRQADRAEKFAAEERARMVGALQQACAALRERANNLGAEVASKESASVAKSIRSAAGLEERNMAATIEAAMRASTQSLAERSAALSALRVRIADARDLMDRSQQLWGVYT